MYIHINTYTYIYIYIYTHIHICSSCLMFIFLSLLSYYRFIILFVSLFRHSSDKASYDLGPPPLKQGRESRRYLYYTILYYIVRTKPLMR